MILLSSLSLMLSVSPVKGEDINDMRFDRAFSYVYENEGGFVNDRADSGGPTKFGVTIKTLSSWRGMPQTASDVKKLTIAEAKSIMKKLYWDKMLCESIHDESLAIAVFDASILFGVRAAGLALQSALKAEGHAIKLDGSIGPKTLEALNRENPHKILGTFSKLLADRVETICQLSPSKKRFQKGWHGRIERYAALTNPREPLT